jgi:hypothetical protein
MNNEVGELTEWPDIKDCVAPELESGYRVS